MKIFTDSPETVKISGMKKPDFSKKKRILVIGINSYIGKSFLSFVLRWPDFFQTDITDVRDCTKKSFDFSGYDAVLYDAGTDDALKTADIAKKSGAGMFLYLSSLHVYGKLKGMITIKTPVLPSDEAGKKEFAIEKELWKRNDRLFCISIIRLPEVYGYECPGSYHILSKLVRKLPFFPLFGRKCSRIHIDNVSSVIRNIIYYKKPGVYFPQDIRYESAYEMALEIAEFHGKDLKVTKILNPLIRLLAVRIQILQDIFHGYLCDQRLNVPVEWIEIKSIKKSIRQSESGW